MQNGLIILEALYGKAEALDLAACSTSSPAGDTSSGAAASQHWQQQQEQQQQQAEAGPHAGASAAEEADQGHTAGEGGPGAAEEEGQGSGDEEERRADRQAEALLRAELPPQWLDVTTPVRFLVDSSQLLFHQGAPFALLLHCLCCASGKGPLTPGASQI